MTAPPRLSVVLPYWLGRPSLEALDIARNAAAAGYGELWVGEMMTFDAFALASAIVRETRDMRVTVGPLAIGLRTPAQLALGVASLKQLGGRRADLALGSSTPIVVSGWHGRAWEQGSMVAAMRESVASLRQLLAGERSDFSGVHVRSHGFRLLSGAQESSITLAAFGSAMVRLAAQIADRVVVNLVTPAQAQRFKTIIESAALAAGRNAPPLAAWIPVALDPDDAAYEHLARQLVVYLAPPGYGEMFIDAGYGDIVGRARSGTHPRELLAAIPRELMHDIGAVGDITAVRRKLEEFHAAGIDEIGVVPCTANDTGGARLLAALAE